MASQRISWATQDSKIRLKPENGRWQLIAGYGITTEELEIFTDSGLYSYWFDTRAEALAAAQSALPHLNTRVVMHDIVLERAVSFYDFYRLHSGDWAVRVQKIKRLADHLPKSHMCHRWSPEEWSKNRMCLMRWLDEYIAPHNRSRAGVVEAADEWLQLVRDEEQLQQRIRAFYPWATR